MLKAQKVLVTGGTGFIGSRLVEKLFRECGAEVRVLVRDFAHASPIARFPVEMIAGDVTDREAVCRAARGCKVIFHCAYGNAGTRRQQKKVTVRGTEVVAAAAKAVGASRLVHVSSVAVYGQPPAGDLDETAKRRRSGELYADTKLQAERLVFQHHRKYGLPVVVIQPTIVYGPFSQTWTVPPLQQLKTGRIPLLNGGEGLCNTVYVDDVVQALILAASRSGVEGEAFLISAEAPVTWRDFYGAYEEMLGCKATVSMSGPELRAYIRREKRAKRTMRQLLRMLREEPDARARFIQLPAVARAYSWVQSAASDRVLEDLKRWILGNATPGTFPVSPKELPIHIPPRDRVALLRTKTRVRIDKARERLGYEPRFDLRTGMDLTAKWARWANLL